MDASFREARRWQGDAGNALLELGLTLPLLAAVVFGVIDMGRVWSIKYRLTNMAREGASFAQFNPGQVEPTAAPCTANGSTNNIVAHAKNEDAGLAGDPAVVITVVNLSTNQIVTGCSTTVVPGKQIRVTVRFTAFRPVTPPVQAIMGTRATLTGSATVVVQG